MNVNNILKGFDAKALLSKLEKYKYVLLIVLVGIVLMLLPIGGNDTTAAEENAAPDESQQTFDLADFQRQMEEILSQIDGAGKTSVVLTLKTSTQTILAEQTESSNERDKTEVVTVSQGSGYTQPVVTMTVYPQFQGALIVCQGGDSAQVRLQIVNAVASLTGLGSDKITVAKGRVEKVTAD